MDVEVAARRLAGLPERPLWRVAAAYAVLFGALGLLARFVPGSLTFINAAAPTSGLLGPAGPGVPPGAGRAVAEATVALASASLLMLPVTWVYVQTRRKKGFDQSIVQTLIALPLVVAGVILLVRDSTALAFSLGGIVGAVAFRNRLQDTKDTIYVFLAIVIGVAAGVRSLIVAATISACFSAVAALMWWTDFGRLGARLEGPPAERRLRRARDLAGRSSGFVAVVDRELLQSMTPDQLDALAERARVRQHQAAAGAGLPEEWHGRRDWTLRLQVAGNKDQGRRVAEPLLARMTKRWQLLRAVPNGAGSEILEYRIRIRKKSDRADFLGRFRAAAGAAVQTAELSSPSD